MNYRNTLIRIVFAFAGGYAIGTAGGVALNWIIVAASLSTFVTFLVCLLAYALMIYAAMTWGYAVERIVTNARIDKTFEFIASRFKRKPVAEEASDAQIKVNVKSAAKPAARARKPRNGATYASAH